MERYEKRSANRKLSDDQVREAHGRHTDNVESIVKLAKEYGVTRHNLRKRFIVLGLTYDKVHSGSSTNHKFFEVIDSELKAYLLGFIIGDGNITVAKPYLNVQVQERDEPIVNLFRTAINKDLNILKTKPRSIRHSPLVKFSVYSKKIVACLKHYGVVSNKSRLTFSIQNVPDEYWNHLIRGFMDADGCIHRKKNDRQLTIHLVGTCRKFLEQIQSYLAGYSVETSIYTNKSSIRQTMYTLYIKAPGFKKFYNLMYGEAQYYLNRKHHVLKSWITPS